MMTSIIRAHRNRRDMLKAWARHDAETFAQFTGTVGRLGIALHRSRILDLGCGSNAPMSVLLHSAGAQVIGADMYVGYRWGLGFKPSRYVGYLHEAGLAKTARKIIGEYVYDRIYYSELSQCTGLRLSESGLDLRLMDVTNLAFENASFDVVHSNATWEHVMDVARANREVARVLRPGGIAYIEIHLFPSLSGGHDLPWIVPGKVDLGGAKPWGHLRDPQWQAPVPLNRLRGDQYAELFRATAGLDLVEWIQEYTEGADLLTADLRQELVGYSPEELTRRSIIAVLRKG